MKPVTLLQDLFSAHKVVIGVVHLSALPGSPAWQGDMNHVLDRGLRDAQALVSGGVDALIVENFGDVPFLKGPVGPETVAAMALATDLIVRSVGLPVGVNVLRNDPVAALGLAYVTGACFIRVNVHTGVMVTDQGVIEGSADGTMRRRAFLGADVKVFADVLVKHAVPLGDQDIREAAKSAIHRGLADGLIVTGSFTGEAAALDDLEAVKEVSPGVPVFVGSGVTEENVESYLARADGVIVGTSLKVQGIVANAVDRERVTRLVQAAARVRASG